MHGVVRNVVPLPVYLCAGGAAAQNDGGYQGGGGQQNYSNPCQWEMEQFMQCANGQADLSLCTVRGAARVALPRFLRVSFKPGLTFPAILTSPKLTAFFCFGCFFRFAHFSTALFGASSALQAFNDQLKDCKLRNGSI